MTEALISQDISRGFIVWQMLISARQLCNSMCLCLTFPLYLLDSLLNTTQNTPILFWATNNWHSRIKNKTPTSHFKVRFCFFFFHLEPGRLAVPLWMWQFEGKGPERAQVWPLQIGVWFTGYWLGFPSHKATEKYVFRHFRWATREGAESVEVQKCADLRFRGHQGSL